MRGYKIINGNIITPARVINGGTLYTEGAKILEVTDKNNEDTDFEVFDAKGMYIAPGFIDIHVHGGGGGDFLDGTAESYLKAGKLHAKYGTTSMLPSGAAGSFEQAVDSVRAMKDAKTREDYNLCSDFMGVHFEGPYFNKVYKGAINEKNIKNPVKEEYEKILNEFDCIKLWSAAPEMPGALEFARFAKSKGVVVSCGHSNATYEEVLLGWENGFSHVTHLYNAMSTIRKEGPFRKLGLIESAYLIENMTVEVISDGNHVPVDLIKMVYKFKGPSRICSVTDCSRAAGAGETEITLGKEGYGVKYIVENGLVMNADRTGFAGSAATADMLLRVLRQKAQIPICDCIRMLSTTPAETVGIAGTKGTLVKGKDADIVVFDEGCNVNAVFLRGKILHILH